MKKIIGILSIYLLPLLSFAQNHGFRMTNFVSGKYGCDGFESSHTMWGAVYFLIFTPLVLLILTIGLFIFWLLMLIDAIKHSPEKTKLIWVIVIIFTQIIGAIIYYFVEKKPRNKNNL